MKKGIKFLLLTGLVLLLIFLLIILLKNYNKEEKAYKSFKIGDNEWKVYNEYSKNKRLQMPWWWIDVYQIDEGYLIITYGREGIKTVGVLSPERKWIYWLGPSPITFNYELDYEKVKTFDEIETIYGKNWINADGDLFYITNDGKIIYFSIYDSVLYKAVEKNLITEISDYKYIYHREV